MFALDLFNTDHERRLAEGAVDKLEQRRIDDLAMKMDDLVARAKDPAYKKNPAALAALMKEFQKCKAERDSYYKIREGGIPGNVPTEKIPGKEDLLKGKGRSYYEAQTQKKNSEEVDEGRMGEIDAMRQDLERMNDRQFYTAYGISKAAFQQKYRTLLKPALDEHGGGIGPKQHWQDLMQENKLSVGDPVVVTGPNEFEGKTGEIYDFAPSGTFVVVDLYNHGRHSMHLSDIAYNEYADQEQDEEDDWYDDEEVAEGWSDAMVARRTGTPRTPYSVYIKGKKWKDFENDDHAEAVANKLRAKFKAEGRDPSVITIAPTDIPEGVAEAEGRVDPILLKALNNMPDGLATHGQVLNAAYDAYAMELGKLQMKSEYGTTRVYIPKLMGLYKDKHGLTFNESSQVNEADGIHPKLVTVLKQRGYKGPYKLSKLPKWLASLSDIADADAEIMVTGKDPEYDAWVVYNAYGPYAYGQEMGYQMGTAAKVIKDTVPLDEEGKGTPVPAKEFARGVLKDLKKVNVKEVKADPTGSWIVYGGNKVMKFKTHTGAKAYAEKNGGKVASSEFYADKIQKPINELDINTLKSYADKRGVQVAAMKADNPNPATGSKEWIQQAVPAQQVNLAKCKIARKERQAGVGEAIVASGPSKPLDDRAVRKMVWDTMKINADTGEQAIQRALAVLAKKPQSRMVQDLQDKFQSLADRLAQGVLEGQTDYQKRRQRERDVDAGRPVKALPKNPQTDYARKRAKDRKEMELGEESSTDSDAVERAILNRIMTAHTDLLMKFGPEKVMQAAEEVAYNVGDVDEIGTSDVSAYVAQVKQILGVPEEVNEKWSQKYKSSINCANPKGFSQKAHCAGRKK